MKKIALLMLLALPLIIISCEKEHSDPTISEETFPTILGQWPVSYTHLTLPTNREV